MRLTPQRPGREDALEVGDSDLLHFANGLIGLEQCHRFALLPDPRGAGIEWLQSVDDESIALPVLEPCLIWPEYDAVIAQADAEALQLSDPADAHLLVIVTPREDPRQASANLRAPLLINRRTRAGRQVILDDARHPIRASLVGALAAAAEPPLEGTARGDAHKPAAA